MLNLRRGIGTHEPSVISLGQVWVDIMLNVDEVTAPDSYTDLTLSTTPDV